LNTPIYDFVTKYCSRESTRLHMPGHKGNGPLGFEQLDLTEIDGADELWTPEGIIAESEANASSLFGARTFYSVEGSSLCVRSMIFLIKKWAHINGRKPTVLAGRNAHRTFIYAAALMDIDVDWIMPSESDSYQMCTVTGEDIDCILSDCTDMPAAVYLTSPDYLGNILDIKSIAHACHRHGVFLIVDNAHGAYLKFMKQSLHPMDLSADMCCDSAHKTLPALTGAAYLHISSNTDAFFADNARSAMALFASTSPSYLIMQSLDLCNKYLSEKSFEYEETATKVSVLKSFLNSCNYSLSGNEPLKVTIFCRDYGYTGNEISEILKQNNIWLEYHDEDYVVMMFSPNNTDNDFELVKSILSSIPQRTPLERTRFCAAASRQIVSFSEAILADSELIDSKQAVGRILADPVVSTPPCVPLYMCGEIIDTVLPSGKVRVIKEVSGDEE